MEEVGLLEEFEEKIRNGYSGRGGGCLVETGVMCISLFAQTVSKRPLTLVGLLPND